jgi:hypothetical protein
LQPDQIASELSLFADPAFPSPWAEGLAHFHFDIRHEAAAPRASDDARFAHEVLEKILRRGSRPFPSLSMERWLIETFGQSFGISERPREQRGSIVYDYGGSLPAAYESFADFGAPWAGDPEQVALDPEHPENERRFFRRLLDHFGPRLASYLYPQVELRSLLPEPRAKSFLSQRADFFLALPNGAHLILEPGDHDDPAEHRRDQSRDRAFLDIGIGTLRLRNADIDRPEPYERITSFRSRSSSVICDAPSGRWRASSIGSIGSSPSMHSTCRHRRWS